MDTDTVTPEPRHPSPADRSRNDDPTTQAVRRHVTAVRLHEVDQPYGRAELDERIVNVDANWRYRRGRLWHPAGAHSDIWYPESAHMLLSLANLAR